MFKKVDASLFDGLEEEKDIAKKYKVKWPKDFDEIAQAVHKDVIAYCKFGKNKQAYKIMFLDGDTLERKWFYMTPKAFNYLKRWNKHCEERIKWGASFRDAWDIHWWIARAMPEALKSLKESLHGYPMCSIGLWNELAKITGDEQIDEIKLMVEAGVVTEAETKTMSDDDIKVLVWKENRDSSKLDEIRFQTWKKSIERLEFLFREYNEDTCSLQNPYKFEWHYDWKPIGNGKFSEMVWNGTTEQKAEHDRYMSESMKLDMYRSDCLHKAMKVLEIFLEYLWD